MIDHFHYGLRRDEKIEIPKRAILGVGQFHCEILEPIGASLLDGFKHLISQLPIGVASDALMLVVLDIKVEDLPRLPGC